MDSAFKELNEEKRKYRDSLQQEKRKLEEMIQKSTANVSTINAVMPLQLVMPKFWNG
jgi:hypothetical protein